MAMVEHRMEEVWAAVLPVAAGLGTAGALSIGAAVPGALAAERRRAPRIRVEDATMRVSCRILPGGGATLVDVSAYGLLVETTLPLGPGRAVHLQIGAPVAGLWRAASVSAAYQNVDGCVIRCAVVALCALRGPIYRVGVILGTSLWEVSTHVSTTGVLRVRSPVDDFVSRGSRGLSGADSGVCGAAR